MKTTLVGLLVLAGVVIGAVLVILHDTVEAIIATWSGSTAYSHGFLIIPICLYLVWRRRSELSYTALAPDLRGPLFPVAGPSD